MSDPAGDRPDPTRLHLLHSVFHASALTDVAEAISVATEDEREVYVERLTDGWRWSLTHPGSGYPLLRITARFLRVDYHRITVPFRTVEEGVCIVCKDPGDVIVPDTWAVLQFDGPTPADVVEQRIVQELGDPT